MTQSLKEKILDATDDGLRIIKDYCPQASAVGNIKKPFSIRPDDDSPSAYLYGPDAKYAFWHIKDYGGEGRFLSPFDVYMDAKGYTQQDFNLALHELAQEYGVTEVLNPSVNCPKVVKRERIGSEFTGMFGFKPREGFTLNELRVWGPKVEAQHLTELGWSAVEHVYYVNDSSVTERHSTDNYPMFVQKCPYIENGEQKEFHKLYEPKNPNKTNRFRIIGKMPRNYVFGLDALRRAYNNNGEERLSCVALVSGGSDAANCLSMGVQPVWLMSETAELTPEIYHLLLKYGREVIHIPDADATGLRKARQLALCYLDLKVAWLPDEVLHKFRDGRGRPRKDLKDYVTLFPK